MDVSKIAAQNNVVAPRQSSDPSKELQRLQQQKELLTDRLTTLQRQREQGMKVNENVEEKIKKQLKEIDEQIAELQKQVNEQGPKEQGTQQPASRYDVLEKTAKNTKVNPAGIYRLEQGEDGKPKLVYDKPQTEKAQDAKQSLKVKTEDETTKTDRQQGEKQKEQLTTELAQAAVDQDKTGQLQNGFGIIEAQLSLG